MSPKTRENTPFYIYKYLQVFISKLLTNKIAKIH